jgi:hypothetical protein
LKPLTCSSSDKGKRRRGGGGGRRKWRKKKKRKVRSEGRSEKVRLGPGGTDNGDSTVDRSMGGDVGMLTGPHAFTLKLPMIGWGCSGRWLCGLFEAMLRAELVRCSEKRCVKVGFDATDTNGSASAHAPAPVTRTCGDVNGWGGG